MYIFFGLLVLGILIAATFKVGVFALKLLFTILGFIVGGILLVTIIPLGLGFGLIFLVPAIIIGVIACIVKSIMFIL